MSQFRHTDRDGNVLFEVADDGSVTLHVPSGDTPSLQIGNDVFDTDPNDPALKLTANDDGSADVTGTEGLNLSAPSRRVRVHGSEFTVEGVNAAPNNADLGNGSFALWLDATPGATKLMIKAKDSGGTVRTAAISLT